MRSVNGVGIIQRAVVRSSFYEFAMTVPCTNTYIFFV
jgi:hypothetical protein